MILEHNGIAPQIAASVFLACFCVIANMLMAPIKLARTSTIAVWFIPIQGSNQNVTPKVPATAPKVLML